MSTAEDRTAAAPGDRRWLLEDEAEFLRRSIADADAEHEAGDLSDADHQILRRRDVGQLARVERALADLQPPDARTPPSAAEHGAGSTRSGGPAVAAPTSADGAAAARSRGRRRHRRPWLAVVGSVILLAGVVLGVLRATSPRLLGEGASGSVDVNTTQLVDRQLAQAAQQVDQGTAASLQVGLALYQQVLREDPRQPQALAETGYLTWEAGYDDGRTSLADRGRALVLRSIAIQPDDYAARLFAGTIDLRQGHDASAAVGEFRAFLAERPPASLLATAAPTLRAAFTAAGQPVPADVPG